MASELRRSLRLQKLLNTVKQTEKVSLERAQRAVEACQLEQLSLLESFAGDSHFYGKYVDLISRRIRELARRGHSLEIMKVRREAEYRNAAARARAAEEFASRALDAASAASEKRELAVTLELMLSQGRGKSPKSS